MSSSNIFQIDFGIAFWNACLFHSRNALYSINWKCCKCKGKVHLKTSCPNTLYIIICDHVWIASWVNGECHTRISWISKYNPLEILMCLLLVFVVYVLRITYTIFYA